MYQEIITTEKVKRASYWSKMCEVEMQFTSAQVLFSQSLIVLVYKKTGHCVYTTSFKDNKYDVGSGEQFDDLVGLIEHFRSYPIIETSGDVLRLLQPVSGTRLRANGIERKVREMNDFQRAASIGFDGEFHSLKIVDDMHVFTTSEGIKLENSDKNRYRNILPYDQTRVILRESNEHQSDYINANYIRSPQIISSDSSSSVQSSNESLNSVNSLILRSDTKKTMPLVTKSLSDDALREVKRCIKMDKINGNLRRNLLKDKLYIATQGCLPNTTNDFWRMLWQEDVRVITMITNEVEKGKKKCERYWPLSGEEMCYDDLTVKSISETCYEDFLLREFDVSDKNNCRTIYQYQYTSWPDHGTPQDPDGVLTFIEDVNRRMYRIAQEKDAPEQNVLCVHCSAGVGRTGTFIVLDMLIDKIRRSGFNCEIDVHSMVKLVRAQRYGMVQNKTQYRFIYSAIQNYIDNNNIKLRKKVYTSEA